jgi:hypothetical protein
LDVWSIIFIEGLGEDDFCVMNRTFLLPLLIFTVSCGGRSDNLLVNANAELPRWDSVPVGWENISGKWVALEGDSLHHDFGYADSGKYYFFAGFGSVGILQQEVDLMRYANDIDAGKMKLVLNGFERSLDQGPLSDEGMLNVQCLDASKNKILYNDSTDTLMSKDKWKAIVDTFLPPKFTRFVNVQLVAIRHVGGDNDGYFDNISLFAIRTPNYMLIGLIVVVIVLIVAGVAVYGRRVRLP